MKTSFADIATKGVQGLTPYQPGKPVEELERELGITDSIKLASNENPLGPSEKVQQVLEQHLKNLHLYPDGGGFKLREKLSEVHDVTSASITLGNGSNDVLELIARAFLTDKDSAVYSEYAFAVYPLVVQAIGAKAQIAKAYTSDHISMPYGHDLDAIFNAIDETTKIVFIANPNNPTGTWLDVNDLHDFLSRVDENVIVVLDEAYFEYMPEDLKPSSIDWLAEFSNLIITRTFSKIHALAGLRIGYAVSSESVADLLNRVRQPFNVNTLAQDAAFAALDDEDHIEQSVALNNAGLFQLKQSLDKMNLTSIPTIGNFITVDVKHDGQAIYNDLLKEGVIVRPVGNYGLPNHLRITVGSRQQNERVIAALKKVLGEAAK